LLLTYLRATALFTSSISCYSPKTSKFALSSLKPRAKRGFFFTTYRYDRIVRSALVALVRGGMFMTERANGQLLSR
jgi:hypothetical protein